MRTPPPLTPPCPAVRTGSATNVAPTPSHPVSSPIIKINDVRIYGVSESSTAVYVVDTVFVPLFCLLSNLPEDQAHSAKPQRTRKRLQLLCDSGGGRQVGRQRAH